MSIEYPWSREKVNGRCRNGLISELIYELTGQKRCRKAVSSHIQVLKTRPGSKKYKFRRYEHCEQAYGVPNAESPVSDRVPTIFTQTPNAPPNLAPILERLPSPSRNAIFTQSTLSISLVSHWLRTECIEYLNIHFDFGLDRHAVQHFYSAAPVDLIVLMRHARITMVEGYMPPLPEWPNLRTLQIELWPRNPARPEVDDREWGWQTEELLARLGVTLAVRARITLEMRWAADCERFEREYVNTGRWRRTVVDEGDAVIGREEGFCRTTYETCGN